MAAPATPETRLLEVGGVRWGGGRVWGKRRCQLPSNPSTSRSLLSALRPTLLSEHSTKITTSSAFAGTNARTNTQPRKERPPTPTQPSRQAGGSPPRSYAPVFSSGHARSTWIDGVFNSSSGDRVGARQRSSSAAEKIDNGGREGGRAGG